jgi:hypothetical protein
MSDCNETLEEYLDNMLHDFTPDQATGESLDNIAGNFLGYARHPGESDAEFRLRLMHALALDDDRRFARKVEALVKQWDEEDDQSRPSSNESSVQPPQELSDS